MTTETEQIVKKAIEITEKTGNFVIEQTPLLIQDFFRWHIAQNIFGLIMGLLIVLFGVFFPLFFTQKDKGYNKYLWRYCYDNTAHYIMLSVFVFIGIIIIICCAYELIFIMTAPKIYLIEYFTKTKN